MKLRTQTLAVTALLACMVGNAFADPYFRYPERHGEHFGHGVGALLAAPLILAGAVIGATVSAITYPVRTAQPVGYVQPMAYAVPTTSYYSAAPVYTAPVAVPPQLPPTAQYFCGSVGQYYPATQFCPEGWQLVRR